MGARLTCQCARICIYVRVHVRVLAEGTLCGFSSVMSCRVCCARWLRVNPTCARAHCLQVSLAKDLAIARLPQHSAVSFQTGLVRTPTT